MPFIRNSWNYNKSIKSSKSKLYIKIPSKIKIEIELRFLPFAKIGFARQL